MRTPRPPYPDIENADTFAGGVQFRLRQPQLPATPDTPFADIGRALGGEVPLGEPLQDVDVRSTYDVRPINAYDFNVTITGTTNNDGEGGTKQVVLVPFAVPLGYVAVVRAFNHSFSPIIPASARADVLMTVTYQNADLPFNSFIPVGAESQDLVKTFFIADEGATVGVRFTTTIIQVPNYVASVQIYGNLLKKDGRSANLMIGNPVRHE